MTVSFRRPYYDEPGRATEIVSTVAGSGSALVGDEIPDVRRTFTFSVVDAVP
ncbi:hypothetical protein [Microbacterium sp. GXF0217]